EDRVHDLLRGLPSRLIEDLNQPFRTELATLRVDRFGHAVAAEHVRVACGELERDLIVGSSRKRTERNAWQLDLHGRRVAGAANGIWKTGIGERHTAALEIEGCVTERAVILLELPLVQNRIDRCEHAGGTRPFRGESP